MVCQDLTGATIDCDTEVDGMVCEDLLGATVDCSEEIDARTCYLPIGSVIDCGLITPLGAGTPCTINEETVVSCDL